MIGSIRLGAIAPVSFCEDPIYLTTRFQPGRSVRNVFGRTMFRGTRQDLELAHKYMRAIATWTACFRQAGAKEVGGFTPEQFISFVRDRTLEISRYIGAGQQAQWSVDVIGQYLDALSDSDVRLISRAYPPHGGISPQNF